LTLEKVFNTVVRIPSTCELNVALFACQLDELAVRNQVRKEMEAASYYAITERTFKLQAGAGFEMSLISSVLKMVSAELTLERFFGQNILQISVCLLDRHVSCSARRTFALGLYRFLYARSACELLATLALPVVETEHVCADVADELRLK
jgi:hypothetical protein